MVLRRLEAHWCLIIAASVLTTACIPSLTGASPTWPLDPMPAGSEADADARIACSKSFESAGEPIELVVADRRSQGLVASYYRGSTYSLLVVVREQDDVAPTCELSLGGSSPIVEGSAAVVTASARWRDGWALAGAVEPGVDAVVVGLDQGQVRAALSRGYFVAFWPMPAPATSIAAWRDGSALPVETIAH